MNSSYKFLIAIVLGLCFACTDESPNDQETAAVQSPVNVIDEATKEISKDPQNAELYYERGQLYLISRKIELAENDFNISLSLDSTVAKYFVAVSDVHFAKNNAFRAKAALDRGLSLDPENMDALLRMAEILLIVKRHQESIEYINRALRIDEHNAKGYFMKGMNYKEFKDTAKAVSSFQTCIEQDPDYYDAFMQLGIIMEAKEDPLAIEYFNGAINLKPESLEAYYGKALFDQSRGYYDEAIISYTKILSISPCHQDAHFNLGYIHYVFLKSERQAIKHYDDAIACNRSFLKAYYNKGLAFEALGDVQAALGSYTAALEVDPNYIHAQQAIMRVNAQ